jgi:uncharacterized protein
MSLPRGKMEPFYFGPSTKSLFGIYHAPQGALTHGCGVVLCYPMGNEYIQFHRAYRQLAVRLSASGFPVLRFDFYGCGDSSGTYEQAQIGQWLTDITTALREIRERCALMKVCLVGCRFGGTLAAMAGAERGDIDAMVLWDAVVNGRAYLEDLILWHQETLRSSNAKPLPGSTAEQPVELLGFPLTDDMLAALNRVDLLALQQKPAKHILVIADHTAVESRQLSTHLQRTDAQVEYRYLPSPQSWRESIYITPMSVQILQAIVTWIVEVLP